MPAVKFLFGSLISAGLVLGILSLAVPLKSIGLYQWIMERFNWKVTPINMAREVRNTRILGFFLIVLSLAIPVIALH